MITEQQVQWAMDILTAASWMVQNGASFEQVAAVLGDRIETVQKHYGHFSAAFVGDAIGKIG